MLCRIRLRRRPPNDWPMCRRSGRGGLETGEAWAVGTIGLLGTPDVVMSHAFAPTGVRNDVGFSGIWLTDGMTLSAGPTFEASSACAGDALPTRSLSHRRAPRKWGEAR